MSLSLLCSSTCIPEYEIRNKSCPPFAYLTNLTVWCNSLVLGWNEANVCTRAHTHKTGSVERMAACIKRNKQTQIPTSYHLRKWNGEPNPFFVFVFVFCTPLWFTANPEAKVNKVSLTNHHFGNHMYQKWNNQRLITASPPLSSFSSSYCFLFFIQFDCTDEFRLPAKNKEGNKKNVIKYCSFVVLFIE